MYVASWEELRLPNMIFFFTFFTVFTFIIFIILRLAQFSPHDQYLFGQFKLLL